MRKPLASTVVGIGPTWLDRRQMGLKNPLGTRCHIYEQIYSSILPCGRWDHSVKNPDINVHGGVFSLEFSPEGSLLVAACEKRSVLMFDPLTQKRIHTVKNAHLDCVNCVKFLDSRSFATCSDDFTVALWDARNLSQKVRSLNGHSNWVKNIEYSPRDGLLVTSGFDGTVLTWEMNNYREDGNVYNKVFSTNGLMRTRLTPDASKMIVCTTGGYLILIHNLDLNTLSQDLDGFKPNMYRLMQLSQTILPVASDFTHLFHGQGKRNRVEFVTDFPEGDDAEVVASLLIHPDGHSAISRNVTNNENSEWSCIHNIEERWSSDESDCTDDEVEDTDSSKTVTWSGNSGSVSTTPSYIIQHTVMQSERRGSGIESDPGTSGDQPDLSVSPSDVWEALVAIQEARIRRETDRMASEMYVGQMFRRHAHDAGTQVRDLSSDRQTLAASAFQSPTPRRVEGRPRPFVSSGPVIRRNVSVNTTEGSCLSVNGQLFGRSPGRESLRKKFSVRSRYASLYRRSLVGQYDRTSVLRKPIYNSRMNRLKFKKLKCNIKLNTNYEINETRRLQNESDDGRYLGEAGSSGVRQTSVLSRQRPSEGTTARGVQVSDPITSSSVNAAINSLTQDLSSLENNLNSFRESISNLEGTINSTCNALRRGQSILQTINELIGEGNVDDGNGSEYRGATESTGEGQSSRGGNEGGTTDRRRERMEGTGNSVDRGVTLNGPPRNEARSSRAVSPPSEPLSSNSERTILMGVFRAGNEDGARGTSMRRHNVAAVTVSSTPQGTCHTLVNRPQLENNKSRHGTSEESEKKKVSAKRMIPVNKKIHQNTKRLTHYVEEPNLAGSFIKELCISPDGRIICSPYGNGIRLLSFSPTVQDMLHCFPRSPPVPLHELTLNVAHADIVVSTKFSPYHNLLVSGCVSGKIVYYQPFL